MKFICGVIDRQGDRRILSAESKPTLAEIEDLARRAPVGSYDWGPEAEREARLRTAKIILDGVADTDTAVTYAADYADSVVIDLETDKMWILPEAEISDWLEEHRKVM